MPTPKTQRIAILDELRGFCVVAMVLYHGFYTLGYYADSAFFRQAFAFFMPAEPFFAATFIALCGACSTLSHSNARRGGLLAAVAVGISVVMAVGFPENPIWFGVLHLLATCILLYALLQKPLAHIPALAGIAACALLFALCWNLSAQGGGYFGWRGVWTVAPPASVTSQAWLYPLGLGRIPGAQADYFPLLPWMFCFFAGSFAGRFLPCTPTSLCRSHCRPLAFVGRHALAVYVLHQPVIYGVGMLVSLCCRTGS